MRYNEVQIAYNSESIKWQLKATKLRNTFHVLRNKYTFARFTDFYELTVVDPNS